MKIFTAMSKKSFEQKGLSADGTSRFIYKLTILRYRRNFLGGATGFDS